MEFGQNINGGSLQAAGVFIPARILLFRAFDYELSKLYRLFISPIPILEGA